MILAENGFHFESPMEVEILRTQSDGSQRRVARVFLKDGVACFEIEDPSMPHLLDDEFRDGIPYRGRGERCFPHDGERFLESLKYHFDGAYLRAREIDDPA